MNLICLMENTTHTPRLTAEHGLSLFIKTEQGNLLLDFGQTDAFLHNARVLGVDLSSVDMAVLSHGHYDHGGGMEAFLQVNEKAKVYLHQNAFGDFYDKEGKYIGLNPALQHHPRLVAVEQDTEIAPGITLRMPKEQPVVPLRHGGLIQRVGEKEIPDPFAHELYLEIREGEKRVLLSGCAHKGIENIMAWFSPDVFVGGMHLSQFSPDDGLAQIAQTLKNYNARYIIGHCTGEQQAEFLQQRLGRVTCFSCGSQFFISI